MKRWILDNHRVSEVVTTNVQGLFNFLPGRYDAHELLYESILSAMNVAVTLEDLVVHHHVRSAFRRVKVGSDEWEIVQMIPKRGTETLLSAALSLLRSVEVSIEMAAVRFGKTEEVRWKCVRVIEGAKAMLKLGLLAGNRGRILVRQGHPPRAQVNLLSMSGPQGSVPRIEDVTFEEEEKEAEISNSVIAAPWSETVGEVLHIARPIVHLAGGWGSWRGWIWSAAVDSVSRVLSEQNNKNNDKLRQKEMTRRAINWAWYLLRPPMWAALKDKLAIFAFLGQIPLVGYLFQLLHDMIESLARFYFFTSSS